MAFLFALVTTLVKISSYTELSVSKTYMKLNGRARRAVAVSFFFLPLTKLIEYNFVSRKFNWRGRDGNC